MTDTQQETYAAKIEKLLRRAEHGNTPQAEADACIAKAQELMLTYAIDEEMIARARGTAAPDKIVVHTVDFRGGYRHALFDIGATVARANGCKVMIDKSHRIAGERSPVTRLYMVGFESDVRRSELLITSLEIQCAISLKTWWKEVRDGFRNLTAMEQYKNRRDFVFGYAVGLRSRLEEANRLAKQEASKHEAERSTATITDASSSVALVLQSRKAQVDDWYDEKYGKSSRKVSRNYSHGYGGGSSAGRAAGKSADLGITKVGSQKAIG